MRELGERTVGDSKLFRLRGGKEPVVPDGLVVNGLVGCHGQNNTIFGQIVSRQIILMAKQFRLWATCGGGAGPGPGGVAGPDDAGADDPDGAVLVLFGFVVRIRIVVEPVPRGRRAD